MQIGIVGFGVVGKHLATLFAPLGAKLVIYDKYREDDAASGTREEINCCDLVFLSVPTPATPEGACDLSAVYEATAWIAPPTCIKSTIPPGTTASLCRDTGKSLVFSPEYLGETPFHRYARTLDYDLVVIGGHRPIVDLFADLYRRALGPQPRYFLTDATTAELVKYMENCFFAVKVSFVAQFFGLAKHFNADFNTLREIWVADERVGRSHSTVVGELGFGGRCLPKDLAAIIHTCKAQGADCSLLEEVQRFNNVIRKSIVE